MIESREEIVNKLMQIQSALYQAHTAEIEADGCTNDISERAWSDLMELMEFFAPLPHGGGGKHVNLVFKHIIRSDSRCKED